MKDDIDKLSQKYFGNDISRMRLLGITKYAVATYVLRVQGGWSKESAIKALLVGRRLRPEEVQFIRSMLDRLPSAAVKGPAAIKPDRTCDSNRADFQSR